MQSARLKMLMVCMLGVMFVLLVFPAESQKENWGIKKDSKCQRDEGELICKSCGLHDSSFSFFCCQNDAFYHLCANMFYGDEKALFKDSDKRKTYFLGKRARF